MITEQCHWMIIGSITVLVDFVEKEFESPEVVNIEAVLHRFKEVV